MDLKTHLGEDRGAIARAAKAVGVQSGYMSQMVAGKRPIPLRLVAAMERELGVPRWVSRPKDWQLIWPELIGSPGAPALPANDVAEEIRHAA